MKIIHCLLVALAIFSLTECMSAASPSLSTSCVKLPKPVLRTDVIELGKEEVYPYSAADGTAEIIDEPIAAIDEEEYKGMAGSPCTREAADACATTRANPGFDYAVWVEDMKQKDPLFDPTLFQQRKPHRMQQVVISSDGEDSSIISAGDYDEAPMGPKYSLQEWQAMQEIDDSGADSSASRDHSSTQLKHSADRKSVSDSKSRNSSVLRHTAKRRLAEYKKRRKKALKALRKELRLRVARAGHVVHPPKKRVIKLTRPHLAGKSTVVLGGKLDDFATQGTVTSVRNIE